MAKPSKPWWGEKDSVIWNRPPPKATNVGEKKLLRGIWMLLGRETNSRQAEVKNTYLDVKYE